MMPFVILGDDAFPLHQILMKPFKPTKNQPTLLKIQRIFNYRLSRARSCIENAFGMTCARFLCLARTMFCSPEKAQTIVATCCLLHNYLMRNKADGYAPPGFMNAVEQQGNIVERSFCHHLPPNSLFHSTFQSSKGRTSSEGCLIRENFTTFFSSDVGKVEWQYKLFVPPST